MLPSRFCWTRFGTESGELVEEILKRKEAQRLAHDGMFLWGIGNSVGPAIRELVRLEGTPRVLFSPMRSKPKLVDVQPERVFCWTRATTLEGETWDMPVGLRVISRGSTALGHKRSHYALVCRSTTPLVHASETRHRLCYRALVNLSSKNKLGHSQVTAVVEHCLDAKLAEADSTVYEVGFAAELVYPYFIQLGEPRELGEAMHSKNAARTSTGQSSLPLFS